MLYICGVLIILNVKILDINLDSSVIINILINSREIKKIRLR